MPHRSLCTDAELTALVHAFYDRVRADAELGPIFDAHIADWDAHLARLVDFWSSVLLGTGRYSGMPMPRHIALPGLTQALFERWLSLFNASTRELDNVELGRHADAAAERIAASLWYGYQLSRASAKAPCLSDS